MLGNGDAVSACVKFESVVVFHQKSTWLFRTRFTHNCSDVEKGMIFYAYRELAELNALPYELAFSRFFRAFPSEEFADRMVRERPFRMLRDIETAAVDHLRSDDLFNTLCGCIFEDADQNRSTLRLGLIETPLAFSSTQLCDGAEAAGQDRLFDQILSDIFRQ